MKRSEQLTSVLKSLKHSMTSQTYQVIKMLFKKELNFKIDQVPFRFKDLSAKKVVNWVLTEGSVVFKPSHPWGFPAIIQLEPASKCNLHCKICPVSTGMNRSSGNMDLNLFKKIVDELEDYLLLILFWDWGEPFLNPNSYEMIHYAHERGIKVMTSTNGHLFASGHHARNVVLSGLDVLVFSLDGIHQETYAYYRNRGSLETVLKGIRRVVNEKKLLKSKTPLLNLRFIVMKHNEQELPKLREFARPLGIDILTLRRFHGIPTSPQRVKNLAEIFRPIQEKYNIPNLSQKNRPVRIAGNPCKNLWNCPTIHWDGTVCSCYLDYNEENSLGSLRSQSFKEIWFGPSYKVLRRSFKKSWQELSLCGKCSYGFKGGDIGRESTLDYKSIFPEKIIHSEKNVSREDEKHK